MASKFNGTELQLIAKAAEVIPSPETIYFSTIKYTGLMSGADYMIGNGRVSNNHPLYDLMGNNDYLRELRDSGVSNIISDIEAGLLLAQRGSTEKYHKSQTAYSKFERTSTGALTIAADSTLYGANIPGGYDGIDRSSGWGTSVEAASTSTGLWFKSPRLTNRGRPVFEITERRFFYNGWANANQEYDFGKTWTPPADGIYAFPNVDTFASYPAITEIFTNVGIFEEGVKHLGMKVEEFTVGPDQNQFTVPMPFVMGTRRFAIVLPGTGAGKYKVLSGYLYGEGHDICMMHFALVFVFNASTSSDWARHDDTVTCVKYVEPYKGRADNEIFYSPRIEVEQQYFYSWNSLFVDTVYGELSAKDVFEEVVEGRRVVGHVWSLQVGAVAGHMSKSEYNAYLSTGAGVYPALDEARRTEVLKSWEKIPDSVVFMWQQVKISPHTVKNTNMYKTYGRKRARACKENDFLDKKYNDEYTWKQVDNKMSALTGLQVVACDSMATGTFSGPDVITVDPVTVSITFTKPNPSQVTYATSDGLTGTVTTAEELEAVMSVKAYKIVSGIEHAEALLGVSLTDYNTAATKGESDAARGLRLSDVSVPEMPRWEVIEESNDYDGEVAFLASQVTDYAQFNSKVPVLVRTLLGDRVYPNLIKELKR